VTSQKPPADMTGPTGVSDPEGSLLGMDDRRASGGQSLGFDDVREGGDAVSTPTSSPSHQGLDHALVWLRCSNKQLLIRKRSNASRIECQPAAGSYCMDLRSVLFSK
jgi:hypothetical protein